MASNPFGKLSNWLLAGGGLIGGWTIYSNLFVDHDMPIGPAVDATRKEFHGTNSTFMSYYADESASDRPLVLLHSMNAAANAYEVKPLFEHYRGKRPVYALDLPGFGFSERSNREYSPDLYSAAIQDFLRDEIGEPADVVALSLTSEFMAFAGIAVPDLIHSITLVSPTGFTPSNAKPMAQNARQNEQSDGAFGVLSNGLVGQPLFDLLVTKPSLRFFLSLNFAGDLDEGLFDYHYRSAHQPNARYAPLTFISGKLFTPAIFDIAYRQLTVPTMVVYDTDPNVSFELLPTILEKNSNWRARRIPNTRGLPHFERLEMTVETLDTFWDDIS